MKKFIRINLFLMLLAAIMASDATAYIVSTFSGAGHTDAQLGIDGMTIEDFEDGQLAPGLSIAFGPFSGPPSSTQLSFSTNGNIAWDGSRMLMHDTRFYSVFFRFDTPVSSFGIGFSAATEITDILLLDGGGYVHNDIGNFAEFTPGPGKNLYFRIDAEPGDALIDGIRFDTGHGPANYDHVAFGARNQQAPVPEPSTALLLGMGVLGVIASRRRPT